MNLIPLQIGAIVLVMSLAANALLFKTTQNMAAENAVIASQLEDATMQMTELRRDLDVNRDLVANQNQTIRSLRSQANAAVEEILNAPPEEDGPIAPVLASALHTIDGMWDAEGYPDQSRTTNRSLEPLLKPEPAASGGDAEPAGCKPRLKYAGSNCLS